MFWVNHDYAVWSRELPYLAHGSIIEISDISVPHCDLVYGSIFEMLKPWCYEGHWVYLFTAQILCAAKSIGCGPHNRCFPCCLLTGSRDQSNHPNWVHGGETCIIWICRADQCNHAGPHGVWGYQPTSYDHWMVYILNSSLVPIGTPFFSQGSPKICLVLRLRSLGHHLQCFPCAHCRGLLIWVQGPVRLSCDWYATWNRWYSAHFVPGNSPEGFL